MTHPRYRTRQWAAVRKRVLARDRYVCEIKHDHKCTGRATEVDHIVRPDDGGADYDLDNLQAACKAGNVAKRNIEVANRAAGRPTTTTARRGVGWSRDWTGHGLWNPTDTFEEIMAKEHAYDLAHPRHRP